MGRGSSGCAQLAGGHAATQVWLWETCLQAAQCCGPGPEHVSRHSAWQGAAVPGAASRVFVVSMAVPCSTSCQCHSWPGREPLRCAVLVIISLPPSQ